MKQLLLILTYLFISVSSFAGDSLLYYLEKLHENPQIAYYLNRVSFEYSETKKDSCYIFAQRAYQVALKNNDTVEIAKALANLGESKTNLGQPDLVLRNYKEALKLFMIKKDYFQMSRMHNRLGILYNEIGENTTAVEHYREAIRIQHEHKINKKIEYIYNNIATSLYNVGELELARNYLDSAISVYKRTGNNRGISYANANLGMIYIYKKEYSKAKYYIDLSYKEIRKNDDILKLISTYKLYGLLYMNKENKELALAYADSALTASYQLDFIEITNSTYNFYFVIYKHFKLYETALVYLEKYHNINDSLRNIEKTRILTETKVRFDLELNEQKVINLNNENELNKLMISTQKRWIWVLTGGFFVLLALIGFILFLKKEKYQAEKKLVQKGIENMSVQSPIIKKEEFIEESEKYTTSNLTDEQKESLTQEIIDLFENQKIYLDPECSISMLENKLETNKTYISQVINEKFEQNFKSILKEYRIREATSLLILPENKNLTIEAISQKVGFKSKSVFNTAFKSIHGITPSFFQKENSVA
ncbi:MAG: helix-turn-helix domain-containing protein [Bacteroidales bacterium]|nr:helix-turn-helix domain-containing protein [Bacteroidales bacterium]